MQVSSNAIPLVNKSAHDLQTASASSSSPPAERTKTEVELQTFTSKASPSSSTGKAQQLALLKQIHEHSHEAQSLSGAQTIHNQNVDKVHEQVDAFIEKFVAAKPNALPTEIRDEISSNLGQIIKDAQLDISCYQAPGNKGTEHGKHLIFSSLSVPLLKDAPLCFQLFQPKPGHATPVHTPPNPAGTLPQPALIECASCVVGGMTNEPMGNPGENPPFSIKNPENNPLATVHAYPMDGISDGQTVAAQSELAGFKNPKSAVYSAYDAFVEKVKTGGANRTPIPEIGANNLLKDLKENKFGANPVIVDIRESKEVQRGGALHIEGASILHAPRGVAIPKILADFPDRNTHLVLSCRDGARSALLAADLQALGYQSTVLSDGALGCAKQGWTKAYDADSKAAEKWNEELDLAPPALTEHIRQLKSNISAITAEELASGPKEKNLVVFDVRQENERSSDAIPNAHCVPAGEFEKKARFHAHDLSAPIVIYSGGDGDYRALIAARNLMEMGYTNVKYLEGGYKNHTGQGVPPAVSPSSQMPLGTEEIQEEQESPLLSSAASLNHDFDQDLEQQNSATAPNNKGRQVHHMGGPQWLRRQRQTQATRNRERPATLDDLPKSREVLFNSRNLAARMLGAALEDIQTQFKKGYITPMAHVEQCDQILEAAAMLHGLRDVEGDVLRNLHLEKMTPQTHWLTKEEYSSIADDVDIQLHPEHGVEAVRERKLQSARAADRARHTLMNKTRAAAKALSHVFGAAASSLSYSAAAINNSSLYKRSMSSGSAWSSSSSLTGSPVLRKAGIVLGETLNHATVAALVWGTISPLINQANGASSVDGGDFKGNYRIAALNTLAMVPISFVLTNTLFAILRGIMGYKIEKTELDEAFSEPGIVARLKSAQKDTDYNGAIADVLYSSIFGAGMIAGSQLPAWTQEAGLSENNQQIVNSAIKIAIAASALALTRTSLMLSRNVDGMPTYQIKSLGHYNPIKNLAAEFKATIQTKRKDEPSDISPNYRAIRNLVLRMLEEASVWGGATLYSAGVGISTAAIRSHASNPVMEFLNGYMTVTMGYFFDEGSSLHKVRAKEDFSPWKFLGVWGATKDFYSPDLPPPSSTMRALDESAGMAKVAEAMAKDIGNIGQRILHAKNVATVYGPRIGLETVTSVEHALLTLLTRNRQSSVRIEEIGSSELAQTQTPLTPLQAGNEAVISHIVEVAPSGITDEAELVKPQQRATDLGIENETQTVDITALSIALQSEEATLSRRQG